MEYIGYILLGIVAIFWAISVIMGIFTAFPLGLIGLIAILGFGILFANVVKERIENKDDNHYSKTFNK